MVISENAAFAIGKMCDDNVFLMTMAHSFTKRNDDEVTEVGDLSCADYSMKRANVCRDDVSSTSSSSASASPAHSPPCFSTKQSPPAPFRPPPHQHHQQYVSVSPDHGVTASSQAVTPPQQPAVAATCTASPTPGTRTTSPELGLLDLPAEPRRRAGSRSKGTTR